MRLLHPWSFPGKNTGEGCHFLLHYIFQLFAENLLSFTPCTHFFPPDSLIIFMFITLNSCLGICLSPLHLFLLVGFYLVRSSRTCSSFASFCLSCCWYFVSGELVMCSSLRGVVSCRRPPAVPAVHSPLITQAVCSDGSLLCGAFCCAEQTMWAVW